MIRDDQPDIDLTLGQSIQPRTIRARGEQERDPEMNMMREPDFDPSKIMDAAEVERLLHIAERNEGEIVAQIRAAQNVAPLVGDPTEEDLAWMRRASYAAERCKRLCKKLSHQYATLIADKKERRANRIRLMFIEVARERLSPEQFGEMMTQAKALTEEIQE